MKWVGTSKNSLSREIYKMKLTRNKNKRRDENGDLKNPNKIKRVCRGWSNYGVLGGKR